MKEYTLLKNGEFVCKSKSKETVYEILHDIIASNAMLIAFKTKQALTRQILWDDKNLKEQHKIYHEYLVQNPTAEDDAMFCSSIWIGPGFYTKQRNVYIFVCDLYPTKQSIKEDDYEIIEKDINDDSSIDKFFIIKNKSVVIGPINEDLVKSLLKSLSPDCIIMKQVEFPKENLPNEDQALIMQEAMDIIKEEIYDDFFHRRNKSTNIE